MREHLENLQAQVARVLAKYGVSNFAGLQALGEENPDNVSKVDIDRLFELAEIIDQIVETGEVGRVVEIPIDGFKRGAEGGILVGGRIVFRGMESFDKSHIVTEDGKTLGQDERFVHISNPIDVAGQVVFIADLADEQIVVMEDGTEMGEGKGYKHIDGVTRINGLVVFRALKNDKRIIVLEDGREFGEGYSSVGQPVDVNGFIAYSAIQDQVGFIKLTNGLSIGSDRGYSHVGMPTMIGGDVAFFAIREGEDQFIATRDGRELHKDGKYRYFGLFDVGGRIIARVNKRLQTKNDPPGWTTVKTFVVTEDGRELGIDEDYRLVGIPKDIDGVVAFTVRNDDWTWSVIFEDGRKIELDTEYKKVFGMEQVDSKHISINAKTKENYVREIIAIPPKGVGSKG